MKVFNIYSKSDNWIERTLSNFAHTPFVLFDEEIQSVEGFHQGIKYQDLPRRREVFQKHGLKAKKAGKYANKLGTEFVYWGDPFIEIRWKSEQYYELYFDALFAKFTQNEKAKNALLATENSIFTHNMPTVEMTVDEFQKSHFCQSLYSIRDFLLGNIDDMDIEKQRCFLIAKENNNRG